LLPYRAALSIGELPAWISPTISKPKRCYSGRLAGFVVSA